MQLMETKGLCGLKYFQSNLHHILVGFNFELLKIMLWV